MRAGVGLLPMQPCRMDGTSVGRSRVNSQAFGGSAQPFYRRVGQNGGIGNDGNAEGGL